MSRQINQPINQVRLTNVAVVRYQAKKGQGGGGGNKRFEIACYRNKVLDYRAGLETDLSEVLQTDRIFVNVEKGQFARSQDLQKAFGTKDQEQIARIILERGKSVQVSELERDQLLKDALMQISNWIASHCVHSVTKRPYTANQIKDLLQRRGYQIQPVGDGGGGGGEVGGTGTSNNKKQQLLKKQCLDAVKFLKGCDGVHIERAKMELLIRCDDQQQYDRVEESIRQLQRQPEVGQQNETRDGNTNNSNGGTGDLIVIEQQPSSEQEKRQSQLIGGGDGGGTTTTFLILLHADPSLYRDLNELVETIGDGCRLEIVQHQVQHHHQQQQAAQQQQNVDTADRDLLEQQKRRRDGVGESNDDDEEEDEEVGRLKEQLEAVRLRAKADTTATISKLGSASDDSDGEGEGDVDVDSDAEDEDDDFVVVDRSIESDSDDMESEQNDGLNGGEGDDDDDDNLAALSRKDLKKANKKKKKQEAKKMRMHKQQKKQDRKQANGTEQDSASSEPSTAPAPSGALAVPSRGSEEAAKSCNTCGGSFRTASEYRAHFRTDWHKFNQKLKLKGVPPVSYEEFQLCDADAFFGSADDS